MYHKPITELMSVLSPQFSLVYLVVVISFTSSLSNSYSVVIIILECQLRTDIQLNVVSRAESSRSCSQILFHSTDKHTLSLF